MYIYSCKTVKEKFCEGTKSSKGPDFIDIDADQKDPLLCSIYASEIYQYLRVQEVCINMSI